MESTVIDVISTFEDVAYAFDALTAEEHALEAKYAFMERSCAIATEVKKFGFTDITKEHLEAFENLNELVNLSAEKIIQFKATEGLVEGAKEGIKKFVTALAEFVRRVMEFIEKLFNTFNNKCRTLLMNLPNIQFDKQVLSITKEKMTKVVAVTKEATDFINQNSIGLKSAFGINGMRYFNNAKQFLISFASKSYGVFVVDKDGLSISLDTNALKFEQMTLADGKWSIGDCRNLIVGYQTKQKTYTTIGSYLYKFFSAFVAAQAPVYGEEGKNLRATFRFDATMYSMFSKIQSLWVKQIMAFYKCLGPGIKFADGDAGGPAQLAYMPA